MRGLFLFPNFVVYTQTAKNLSLIIPLVFQIFIELNKHAKSIKRPGTLLCTLIRLII